jgi:hypothetical protein
MTPTESGSHDGSAAKCRAASVRIGLHTFDDLSHNPKRRPCGLKTFHIKELRILKIAIVATGHSVKESKGGSLPTYDLRRFAADKLEHIGVVLLRHNRRASAVFARKAEIRKLWHRENDHILRKTRKNAHNLRECRKKRRLAFAARHGRAEAVVNGARKAKERCGARSV